MKGKDLNIYKESYGSEFKFYNENLLMLSWYSNRIVEKMDKNNVESCISLGIGHKIVSKTIIEKLRNRLKKYLIVEGSKDIIDEYKREINLLFNFSLVSSLFEEFDTEEKFDAIEMGFVLEHVNDPLSLIKRYVRFLKPKGFVFIAVPNARSFHRLIGNKAGVLDDLYRLSEHDRKLGHQRYFDKEFVTGLVIKAGLTILNIEGIFLKPFSTSQMESLKLSPEILNALCSVAVGYPEISNAIYIEATLQ